MEEKMEENELVHITVFFKEDIESLSFVLTRQETAESLTQFTWLQRECDGKGLIQFGVHVICSVSILRYVVEDSSGRPVVLNAVKRIDLASTRMPNPSLWTTTSSNITVGNTK